MGETFTRLDKFFITRREVIQLAKFNQLNQLQLTEKKWNALEGYPTVT